MGRRLTKRRRLAILTRARELLARRGGWIQGAYYGDRLKDGVRACCLLGAIRIAGDEVMPGVGDMDGEYPGDLLACELSIEGAVKKREGVGFIPGWNDSPSRKKSQVLALLDEKIAELA